MYLCVHVGSLCRPLSLFCKSVSFYCANPCHTIVSTASICASAVSTASICVPMSYKLTMPSSSPSSSKPSLLGRGANSPSRVEFWKDASICVNPPKKGRAQNDDCRAQYDHSVRALPEMISGRASQRVWLLKRELCYKGATEGPQHRQIEPFFNK